MKKLFFVMAVSVLALSLAMPAFAAEKVTVRYVTWLVADAAKEVYKNHFFGPFEKQHPNIKIDYETFPWATYWQKVQTDFAAGTPADIIEMAANSKGLLIRNKLLLNLQPYFDRDINLDNFYEVSTGRGRFPIQGGDLYGMYTQIGTGVLYYQRDIFNDAGAAYPEENWDTEKLIEVAKKLTKPNDDQWGFVPGSNYWTWSMLSMHGAGFLNEDLTESVFDTPEAIAAFQLEEDFFHKHKVSPPTTVLDSLGGDMFLTGKVAMRASSAYAFTSYQNIEDFDWAMAFLPSGPKGKKVALAGDPHFSISSASKHKDEAWEVLRWYLTNMNEKNGLNPGNFSANKAVAAKWEEVNSAVLMGKNPNVVKETVEKYGFFFPWWNAGLVNNPEILKIYMDTVKAIRDGHLTGRAGALEAKQGIDAVLRR